MKRSRGRVLLLVVGTLFLVFNAAQVSGYAPGTPYQWYQGVPGYNPSAVIHQGTIDTSKLDFADFMGRYPNVPLAIFWGDSGVTMGWDDEWRGLIGDGNKNGDHLDGLWSQIYIDGGWWDLGHATDRIAVFTSQDHGPYLGEGLEYRIYGSDVPWDNYNLSTQGAVTDVYLDGWRPHNSVEDGNRNGWQSDDVSAIVQLPGKYRYIKLVAWSPYELYNEPEVDAIATLYVQVTIDIKPGIDPNSININSRGVIPVAVLTTDEFDARDVDAGTVRFGPSGAYADQYALEDVDDDGDIDLILHFRTQDTGIAAGDTEAVLTGETLEGQRIEGSDSVRVRENKGRK